MFREKSHILLGIGIGILVLGMWAPLSHAAANILGSEPNHWAWNDVTGWIDFQFALGPNVEVTDTNLLGYASSSVGYIALNCNTSLGNSCAIAGNWLVANDGTGKLSGWAWNDTIGWISFCGNAEGGSTFAGGVWVCPASPTYRVQTSWVPSVTAPGEDWLISSIVDTCLLGVNCGVGLNTIMWKGDNPNGTLVNFQIATDCKPGQGTAPNCTGGADGWNFLGPIDSISEYQAALEKPVKINQANHINKRYFRYKVILESCCVPKIGPKVEDVIINWSP